MYHIINNIVYNKLVYHSDKILQIECQCPRIKVLRSTKGRDVLELSYTFEYLQPNNIFDLDISEIVKDFIQDTRDQIEGKSLIGQGMSYRFKFEKVLFNQNLIIIRINFKETPIAEKIEDIMVYSES